MTTEHHTRMGHEPGALPDCSPLLCGHSSQPNRQPRTSEGRTLALLVPDYRPSWIEAICKVEDAAQRDLVDQLRSNLDGLHSDALPSHSCGKACLASLPDRQTGDSPE